MASLQETQQALIAFSNTFDPYSEHPIKSIAELSTGVYFAQMLLTVDDFGLSMTEIEMHAVKWIDKLTNLKKIMQKMQNYVGHEFGKYIKNKDVDLIQIAKHDSEENILKYFQVVIAIFMQSAKKQDLIQTIMGLNSTSQHALVIIVQNAIEERLVDCKEEQQKNKLEDQINELKSQNSLLKEDLEQLAKIHQNTKTQLLQLKDKLDYYEDQIDKNRNHQIESKYEGIKIEIQQLKTMNQSLKQKLIKSVRDHEEELIRVREENLFLQNKIHKLKESEEKAEHYKEQLDQILSEKEINSDFQKEKRRLNRVMEQKQQIISKLKERLDEINEKNYSMQQNELYMKMQLEKKEVRFNQLQKQVKNRLKDDHITPTQEVLVNTSKVDMEEIDYLQEEIDKIRNNSRELERENLKLKRKVEKFQTIENQKKRLEKIILDVSKSKDSEIEMLVVSLYDLRTENIRMHELLSSFKALK